MSKEEKIPLPERVYSIEGVPGFTMEQFLKAVRSKFDTYAGFEREVFTAPDLMQFIKENWDDMVELDFKTCLLEENTEARRILFSIMDPSKIFGDPEINPELIDEQTISKTRTKWDEETLEPEEYTFEDTYSLYKVSVEELGLPKISEHDESRNFIFAVKCKCTTTDREYWLMVPRDAGLVESETKVEGETPEEKWDAIQAIAWTIQIDVKNPVRLLRQGDVIIAEMPENPEFHTNSWNDEPVKQPITKEQYLTLITSET